MMHFVDGVRLDAGAAHGFGDDFCAEFWRGKRRESAHEFSHRRADGAQYDRLFAYLLW